MRNIRSALVILLLLLLLPLCAFASGGEISGVVFSDPNGKGVYKNGASGIRDAKVTLYRLSEENEKAVGSVTVSGNGIYSFTGLEAGTYRLACTLAGSGYRYSEPCEGGSVMLPAAGLSSKSLPFTLSDNEKIRNAYIGVTKGRSYVVAYVFEDLNLNGGRAGSEPKISGALVTL